MVKQIQAERFIPDFTPQVSHRSLAILNSRSEEAVLGLDTWSRCPLPQTPLVQHAAQAPIDATCPGYIFPPCEARDSLPFKT